MLRFQQLCLAAAVLVAVSSGSALADSTLDNKGTPAPSGDPAAGATQTSTETPVEYGVGVRLRNVRAPKGLLELFLESAPGGVNSVGFGVELVRRRGDLELQLGFEYERIQPAEGVWIQSNTNVAAGDEADYVLSPKHNNNKRLGWLTFEFTFLNHTEITKNFAIRYGGGAGVGIVTGELGRYNVICNGATNETPEPGCVPPELGGTATLSPEGDMMIQKYDLPPVFPVVNAIVGLQIRPFGGAVINIEGGLRTFPFFGVSGGYLF
jgi:hypothetical protein